MRRTVRSFICISLPESERDGAKLELIAVFNIRVVIGGAKVEVVVFVEEENSAVR